MKFINFWLIKAKEKNLIKIVEWAQKHDRKVQSLTIDEVKQALLSMR